ncbi:MAG: hypothetical protein ACRD37_09015, partial [Candidatus Acidiferrales bacterium]
PRKLPRRKTSLAPPFRTPQTPPPKNKPSAGCPILSVLYEGWGFSPPLPFCFRCHPACPERFCEGRSLPAVAGHATRAFCAPDDSTTKDLLFPRLAYIHL